MVLVPYILDNYVSILQTKFSYREGHEARRIGLEAMPLEQQTEFAPDNPAMVGEAFAADLVGAAAFADGMDQLDAVGVDDPEHGRGGQEGGRPVLMGLQEAKEPRPLGELRKQGPIVARQPAIEGAVAPAFEGVEEPQGDHLAGPEAVLGMFGGGWQLLIDLVEKGGHKNNGG